MFFILRHKNGMFFAGFKMSRDKNFIAEPVFVKPMAGNSMAAMVIHTDDVAQTVEDLAKNHISVDRVQVG